MGSLWKSKLANEFICEYLEIAVLGKRIPSQFKSNLFSCLWMKHLWATFIGSWIGFSFTDTNNLLAKGFIWLMHGPLSSQSNSSGLLYPPAFFLASKNFVRLKKVKALRTQEQFQIKKVMKFIKLWPKKRQSGDNQVTQIIFFIKNLTFSDTI